jgi:hypothetical protein
VVQEEAWDALLVTLLREEVVGIDVVVLGPMFETF